MKSFRLVIVFVLLSFQNPYAQNAGNTDETFAKPVTALGDSTRFYGTVKAIVKQQDGKLIIGGDFTQYNGFSSPNIIRLFPDGTIDKTFGVAAGFDGEVNALALQSDGRVIVGGSFTNYNGRGNSRNKIARLNADGSLDQSFATGLGLQGEVNVLALQTDGKILAGGNLIKYNGASCSDLVRLNSDGTLDNNFLNVKGLEGMVNCITLLPGGKLMVGGNFLHHGNTLTQRIARLNSDGSIDNSFVAKEGFNNQVHAILPVPGGKYLVGGVFNHYGRVICNTITRLNSDGSLDNTFPLPVRPTKEYGNYGIRRFIQQPDGKIIIAGVFDYYGTNPCQSIARLNADGSFDASFNTSSGFDRDGTGTGPVHAVLLFSDGNILTGGNYKRYDAIERNGIALLDKNGKLQDVFNVGQGFDRDVKALAVQTDGKIIVVGEFTTYNGLQQYSITRLLANGQQDVAFNVRNGFEKKAEVNTVALQNDGKIIVGGRFGSYAGVSRNALTRLNADGSLDENFYVGNGFNNRVTAVAVQTDGKVLVVGEFQRYDGTDAKSILRLNANGKTDNSFVPGGAYANGISCMAIQKDGRIIIGGTSFKSGTISTANALVRLMPDGTADNSFKIDPSLQSTYLCALIIQPDGKLLALGKFSVGTTNAGYRLLRFTADGNIDKTFSSNLIYNNGSVNALGMVLQADGKIIVAGDFQKGNRVLEAKIIRLLKDGSVDESFMAGEGFKEGRVSVVALQPNGQLVAGGGFKKYDKNYIAGLVRINTK